MADIKDQLLIEANYILRFITEIEELMDLISAYKVLLFNLDKMARNVYGISDGLFSKEGMEKVGATNREAIANAVSQIRLLASKVKIRYDTLKVEKGFEDISSEYNALFREEIILPADLDNFLEKLNKAYYKLSEEVRKLRKELGGS
jgi:hypothetical protein